MWAGWPAIPPLDERIVLIKNRPIDHAPSI